MVCAPRSSATLSMELLNGLRTFLCALVRSPGPTGRRVYSATSGAMKYIPHPGTVQVAALDLAKLFVVITQADVHPTLPDQTQLLALFCTHWLCLPTSRSSAGRPHSFYTWMPAFPVSWGRKTPSTVSGAVSQLLCLGRRGRGCSRLLLISQTGSQAERGQVLPSAMAVSESPCLCVAWMRSMPDTGFLLGQSVLPTLFSA